MDNQGRTMNRIKPIDIAWLAGIVEGEVALSPTRSSNGKYRYPRIQIKSVDREVVERIQTLTGVGTIYIGPEGRGGNPNNQEIYIWHLGDARNVLHFLCAIVSYGFRSKHRETQMIDSIDLCSQILARKASGESYRRDIPKGSYNSKLTEDQVKLIKNDNRSYDQIAADYPVSSGAIGKIKRGETWTHV